MSEAKIDVNVHVDISTAKAPQLKTPLSVPLGIEPAGKSDTNDP